jgi:hypothetical protein
MRNPKHPSRFTAVLTLIACAASFSGPTARGDDAIEYNLPDPPGYLTFDTVAVRSVATPNEKVPESCETKYRAGMENAFKQIWAQCQQVGKMEPSDCQRALFDRCTQLATNVQKMESGACLKMDGESDAIKSFQGVDNQKNSQSSTADLNRRAYVATKQVINTLQQNASDIETQRRNAVALLNVGACTGSTSARAYDGLAAKVVGQLDATKAHVDSTITQKQGSAVQYAHNSGVSIANLDKLVSLPPRSSTITGASSKPDTLAASTITTARDTSSATATDSGTTTIVDTTPVALSGPFTYTNTVVETITGPGPTTTTVVTVGTSTTASTTITPATVQKAIILPPYIPPPEKKSINWLPILAVGIPAAAILTALVVSKNSRSRQGSDPSPSDGGGGGGGGNDGGSNPYPGNRNPDPTSFPGGGDLAALQIKLDPSFTDRQKAGIAAGLTKIPPCYRYKLQKIYMRNRLLSRYNNGSCVAGTAYFDKSLIDFSPTCTQNNVPVGVAVHEMFHMLGSSNGNELHNKFWPVLTRHPNCAVTPYGATNRLEDFAETGRLLEVNDGSLQAKNPGACVDAKISELGRILSSCPAGSN